VVLQVEGLTVRYGGVVAVDGVSLSVPAGQIVGLIGPNGAGKTTLVDALSGFAAYSGQVRFRGRRLEGMRAHRRARVGMARTFQSGGIFDDLSVEENILIGERSDAGWWSTVWAIVSGRSERPRTRTQQLIDTLDLRPVLAAQVSDLSEGHRKLVAVAQALASGAQLVLFDEPAAGLDSTESLWLGRQLRKVRDSGVSILLVDHDMELVMSICDQITVLDFGKIIAAGSPQQVLADPAVIAAYLGSLTPDATPDPDTDTGAEALAEPALTTTEPAPGPGSGTAGGA
jgi:ABC-type branched-subunit amino acid transport system ATPase component